MYVHLMEMSPRPEDALLAGDMLRDLVPDAGHLRHMPTHIDVLCGDYRRVVASNHAAIGVDEKYRAARGAMNFYTLYRAHDYHFKIYGAMFLGQERTAMEAADQLAAAIPGDLLRVQNPPMADWLEGFVAMRLHAAIRFGRWPEILATPLPADPGLYLVTTAMTHYAKGVAYAASGQVAGSPADLRERREPAEIERFPRRVVLELRACEREHPQPEMQASEDEVLDRRRGHLGHAIRSPRSRPRR